LPPPTDAEDRRFDCGDGKIPGPVFVHLLQELGGFQIRQWELQGSSSRPADSTPDDEELKAIDDGFSFIEKSWRERVVPAQGLKQLHWITRCIKDSKCPIYGQGPFKWTDRLVEKAFTKLREEGVLAKVVTECPYTIQTLSPWFVDEILSDLAPHLHTRSLGLIGKSGVGKTPAMEAIACVFSRYWKRRLSIAGSACYRTSSDLDFFRGEVGTVDRPDALDDADPKTISAAKWKAFTDVGLVESMSRERWGASKWVRNQLRMFACNPFDDGGEPIDGSTVSHAQFMDILEPLWCKDMELESKIAILKRACLIVVTREWVYWRVASEDEVAVKRLKLICDTDGSKSMVNVRAAPVISSWKESDIVYPDDYEEQLAWEEAWINAVMSKGALQIPCLRPVPAGRAEGARAGQLPDGAPLSQLPDTQSEIIRADMDGKYRLPVPVVQGGSTLRDRFRISHAQPSALSTSASSSSAVHPTAPKRVKLEPRDEKARQVEVLKRQLEQAQAELHDIPTSTKRELHVDDGFRDIVRAFSKETSDTPMMIEDSP